MKPPKDWNKYAKQAFEAMSPELLEDGRLHSGNRMVFEALCIEIGEYFRMREEANDLIVKGRGNDTKLNPLVKEARRSLDSAMTLIKHFGITPYGEKLIGLAKEKGEPKKDILSKFLSN